MLSSSHSKTGLSLVNSALCLWEGEFYCLSAVLPLHNVYIYTRRDEPVVGVSNCVTHDIILYLTALNGSEIYRKIVETFREKLIVHQLYFHQMFRPFSDRFRYCLSFEHLNKV